MIEIKKINSLNAELIAPPSKAYTLRALFVAALADGKSVIKNPLMAEDQRYAINALKELGVSIEIDRDIVIKGVNGKFKGDNDLFVGNSGITARILTVMGSLSDGEVTIDGNERMRQRPIDDLLEAIKNLGIKVESNKGYFPVTVKDGFKGGVTKLKGNKSSQYFTSILLSAPYADEDVKINLIGELVSKPFIDITIDIMSSFGVKVEQEKNEFRVKSGQRYMAREYIVEGDYSNSAYFFCAAAITKGRVVVNGLNLNSIQGDKKILDLLEEMGCVVNKNQDFVEVIGKELKGIRADMSNYPDIVQPLAVVAAFAKGKSEFYNISHLKYKECDRIKAVVTELRKMGIKVEGSDDSIIVEGGNMKGCEIETYNDHRMAMSFSIAGLAVEGVKIKNPENVNKSFPGFFDILNNFS